MCLTNILYTSKSKIEGLGLFSNKNLETGDCIGLLAKVYSDNNFDDLPYGRYINHNDNPNIDLKLNVDKKNKIIYVLGIANKYIKKGNELTADYNDKFAPKPNFINEKPYNFEKILKSF
jgi:SET domain-containing protein